MWNDSFSAGENKVRKTFIFFDDAWFILSTIVISRNNVFDVNVTVHRFSAAMYITNRIQQIFRLLIFLIQPYMFRVTNSPILRNTF